MTTLDQALRQLLHLPEADRAGVHVVGGALRDALLGRPVTDVDLAVPGDAATFAQVAARRLGTRVVALGEQFPVFRLPLDGALIDIAPMRGDLADDLAARDFTINALALPLEAVPAGALGTLDERAVIDLYDGRGDLHRRVLRVVAPGALHADAVRALRAVRLACQLDFEVAAGTRDALADPALRGRLGSVAGERVGAELQRIFATAHPARGVRILDVAGLLAACFPVLEEGREVTQRPHRYNVLEHQLVALEMLDVLLARKPPDGEIERALWLGTWDGPDWRTERWGDVREHLHERRVPLRLATLLHDVGKPATRTEEANGRTRFFGHAPLGARLTAEALLRWRFPGALIERVSLLIEQHLRPGQIAPPGEPPTPQALHRFHRALGDAAPELCFLFLADALATAGAAALLPRWRACVAHVHRIVTWQPPAEAQALRRLVDGYAVMRATGLPPGPAVGRILREIEAASATGAITTEQQAHALARRLAEGDTEATPPAPPPRGKNG